MSPDEWNSLHPELCSELMVAWKTKQKRHAIKQAELQLTIAAAAGAKKKTGGSLTLNDFLPSFAKLKQSKSLEQQEAGLKSFFKPFIKKKK